MSKFVGWYYLSYRWQYYLIRPWEFVRDLFRELRAIYQRGTRGWADCDTWSLDYYLSGWMPDALRLLKENKHGIPADFAEVDDKDFEKGVKAWDAVMDKMIAGFEASEKIGNSPFDFPDDFDKFNAKQKDVYWKKNRAEIKRLQKIEQEGLQLFAKYFGNLWD